MDDRALIDALRRGDRDAFSALVELEMPTVYRSCLRILRRPDDAEDVTQETFVAAYRAIGGYRAEGSLRGWLLRIATRRSFRRLSERRPVVDLEAAGEPAVADSAADPARAVVSTETRLQLRDAIAALPDPYREVVSLRFFGELSLIEIAEATGRPVNTIKTHLRRGLERLRPAVEAERVTR